MFVLLAAAALTPDQKLAAWIRPVAAARLKATVDSLVGFGTRHTLSSQNDPNRGIGAALDWTKGRFEALGLATARVCERVKGDRLPAPTRICDMVAIQRGTERPNDVVIITAHIDSRVSDPLNADAFEPGANDDGSGVAAVLEAARVLSPRKFPGTIVYAALSGEEQGLYGGKILAGYARAQGWNVIADLNNDIVGNSCGSDGMCDSTHVRIFSEGPRWQGHEALAADQRSEGGENDSPSRNLSRYLDLLAGRLKIGFAVRQIWRNDRFGRGGDHTEFLNAGYPAVRFTVAVENYRRQHQDVRVEQGVAYGDTVAGMDFAYLARVAKLNVAGLASIASAPSPPEPHVEGAVSTDTKISWPGVSGAVAYVVRWRRTDSSSWQVSKSVPDREAVESCPQVEICRTAAIQPPGTQWEVTLPHVRVDDWVFGVSSVSKDGFESPVASAVPGGAFKPYAPPARR